MSSPLSSDYEGDHQTPKVPWLSSGQPAESRLRKWPNSLHPNEIDCQTSYIVWYLHLCYRWSLGRSGNDWSSLDIVTLPLRWPWYWIRLQQSSACKVFSCGVWYTRLCKMLWNVAGFVLLVDIRRSEHKHTGLAPSKHTKTSSNLQSFLLLAKDQPHSLIQFLAITMHCVIKPPSLLSSPKKKNEPQHLRT